MSTSSLQAAPALARGRWAVVLGVSEGTGAAVARAVARDPGLDVFGVHRGRHPESADAVARDVVAAGRRASMRVAEAGTAESARLGAEALLEIAGPRQVRLFVHSIANASVGPLVVGDKSLEPYQLEKTFNSMAHSFVYWARELYARDLLAPSARLIGLTNPVVGSLVPGLGAIAAGKAALEIYIRQLAIELGPLGHRVNLVNFGLVDTCAGRVGFPDEAWDQVAARAGRVTPAGRLCTVEEVGRLVSVLTGDAAEWFNGATLDFTGGMTQSLLGVVLNQT
jgi:NAD(P)-dependent dehydrogenase (short-subunit alcohol dehydrogenase family)